MIDTPSCPARRNRCHGSLAEPAPGRTRRPGAAGRPEPRGRRLL